MERLALILNLYSIYINFQQGTALLGGNYPQDLNITLRCQAIPMTTVQMMIRTQR